MTTKLKALHKQAIPHALEKAERYRLLNEASEAESICLDVLQLEPDHQGALVMLLLALTDQYRRGDTVHKLNAKEILPQLKSPYERAYYAGIIAERKAKAALERNLLSSESVVYDLLQEALRHFEEAEKLRPEGNDDALLRWNTCIRIIERRNLSAPQHDQSEHQLE